MPSNRKLPEIKACPFCGVLAKRDTCMGDEMTGCFNPDCKVQPVAAARTRYHADRRWNRRSDVERRVAIAAIHGAMGAVAWLRDHTCVPSFELERVSGAIDRGEVTGHPAKAEPWIVSKPGVMGGKPCVRGTRITVETLQSASKDYGVQEIITELYPSLGREQVEAALAYKLPKFKRGGRKS